MITSAKFTDYGSIIAVIDGVEMIVPDTMENRHRSMLAAWETEGNVINPDVEDALSPEKKPERMPRLTARQLRLGLLRLGKLAEVPIAIAALPEPERSQAQIEWDYASEFRRLHPLIVKLIPILGLTDEQVDPVWESHSLI
ncbi:hypothetical protein CN878_19520 [Ochrobactrum sp. 695/2009]|nr:hypothetical protein CN881_22185 [Ochrobactrum sp. 721/2009]PJT16934.1 hypothetical protein CN880_11535 [Ochrobactrum sp. 720/2009]PJT18774.1 hypothetical protein CN879_20725 [Ochrobactrum sp. 715/2009]PJT27964.1 hypothetical protein CN878_19520 [Ochrobactrum sp. 695/2009]PJT31950.1 hypothetical protein CN877_23220 [Ochrobactrum sp. 689/2009]